MFGEAFEQQTLLVDFDAQCNLTQGLGIEPEELERNLFTAMKENSLEDTILEITPKVHLLPGSHELSKFEMTFAAELGREKVLKKLLKKIQGNYDYIVIDCPPAINLAVVNVIVASDYYLVPMHAEFFSVTGIERIINTVTEMKEELDLDIELLGVFLTRFHPNVRKKEMQTAYQAVKDSLGGLFMDQNYIRDTSYFSRSQSNGMDIYRYHQATGEGEKAVEDYLKLAKKILENTNE